MKLFDYLKQTNTSAIAFSNVIGVSVQSIHRYINSERVPKPSIMVRIHVATNGAVTPNDFMPTIPQVDA